MKTLGLKLCAILVGCVAFAACTNATPPQETRDVSSGPLQTSSKVLRHVSATETVLYRFGSQIPDGAYPIAGLTYRDGTMYGVTYQGFRSVVRPVLYSIAPSGKYTILRRFTPKEGYYLFGKLKDVGHNLFGTASFGGTSGGASGCGTVFESTLSGTTTVLHSFQGPPGDGCEPRSHLVDVNGTLYGTTNHGGIADTGTVFSITPSGSEKVIYNFAGGHGVDPGAGGLVEVNGTLYGTTLEGGNTRCVNNSGCGTVFSITPGGKESVLYRFLGGSSDGSNPAGQLVNVNGTLYGTTQTGGGTGCSTSSNAPGCGTVFSITASGRERVLYKFGGAPNDGAGPNGDLIYVSGTMYGTTVTGGAHGRGTVFSITPSGTETVLYSFVGGQDGEYPSAGVIDVNGTLYGTTEFGGGYGRGGTIYSITL